MLSKSLFRLIQSKSLISTKSIITLTNNITRPSLLPFNYYLKQQQQQQSSFHSTSLSFEPTSTSTSTTKSTSKSNNGKKTIKSNLGSGKGGRLEKDAAIKAKANLVKEKAKLIKEKEKAKLIALKEKEKVKAKAAKEKVIKAEKALKAKKALAVKKVVPIKIKSSLHPPKAAPNSWGVFLSDLTVERKAALQPGEKLISATKLAQEAAPLYKALAPSDRAELERRSKEAKAAYEPIYEAWKLTLTPSMIKEENLIRRRRKISGLSNKKPLKVEGTPDRPTTSYMLFSNEVRNNKKEEILQGETSILVQSKLIAAAWRALSPEEKQVYVDQYEKSKVVYEQAKEEFDAKQNAIEV